MKFVNTFDSPLQKPDETFDTYSKNQKIKLGKSISDRKKIYLDTKYWIYLRDAHLNRAKNESEYQFLALLDQLLGKNKIICPISEDIFLEVLKQSDRQTLTATVNLIDKFSQGISLLSFEERLLLELFYFSSITNNIPVYEMQELVWTKLAYTLGFITNHSNRLNANQNNLLKKCFFDQLWSIKLIDIVDVLHTKISDLVSITSNNLNDYHDIRHAVAAIPYCEYFFTEKRLCHMITQKLL